MAPEHKQAKYEGAPPLDPISRKSMKSGMITEGAVSENERPETSVLEAVNLHFDAIGSATLRRGMTAVGQNMTGSILGLYQYVDTVNVSPKSQTIMGYNTSVYYLLSGTTWTSIRTSLTIGSKQRYTTFLNYVFMVNGTEATAVWDGNTAGSFSTGGNASGAPTGKFIEVFQARVWIMGNTTYPSRLFYSSVPSAVTTPVITWNTDVTTGTWIDISPQDGDFPTALQRYRNTLLIFKTNRLYRLFGIGQVDADPWYAVGTSSQESVIETKAGVFFHHSTGIYQYNVYGVVEEVSRPIWDFIRAIPTTAYANIAAWLEPDGDHVIWAVGTITVTTPWGSGGNKGTTYTNCELRYTISTQTWTVYSRPTQITTSIRRQPFYSDGTSQQTLCGDSSGNIAQVNVGTQDLSTAGASTPINFSLIHRWDNLDGLLATRLTVNIVNFSHKGGAGAKIAYQTDDDDPDALGDWSKKVGEGQLKAKNTGFQSCSIKGRKMRFRLWGYSTGQPFLYDGYEIIDAQAEFYNFS